MRDANLQLQQDVRQVSKAGSRDQLEDGPGDPGAERQEVWVVLGSEHGLGLLLRTALWSELGALLTTTTPLPK